ncbi:hypothetical protein Gogos_015303 [Gossypium gossypioides]|uniref:Disease resistance protein At4g27190-like leucine-rich repeats domain-containing protein n=1 Tax=Gossypium gossypioides TaxID=34282 RepID=A0A7J9C1T9_GOSGO|nr:hypothetical protein [Gossypium gossypioides]
MLMTVGCNFKELSPYGGDAGEERDVTMLLPRFNELTLEGVDKMTHLWKQGSPSITFVWYCKEMVELITSSKAQCLEQLVTLKIGGYEMVREVIFATDEATYHETNLKELKCLELYDLQNLKSFCSGNYTLKFPALDDVTVIDCPAMENFCNGALSTPKLHEVKLRLFGLRLVTSMPPWSSYTKNRLSALPFDALKTMKPIAEVLVDYRDPLDMRNRNGPRPDMKATQISPFLPQRLDSDLYIAPV